MALAVRLLTLRRRPILVFFLFLAHTLSAWGQSRYGLSCYGDACATVDQTAQNRMVNAKTVCGSGDTSIVYPKKNKPSADEIATYWRDINAAQRVAESGYREVSDCAKADLIVRITLDTLNDTVSLLVTDADSGDSVFSESRTIQDKRSDLIHAAQHFRDAVRAAQYAAEAEQARLAEEYRKQQEAESEKREQQKCDTEFDSLKQSIIAYTEVQHVEVPQEIRAQITAHNSHCSNMISVEVVENVRKAEIEAKAAQEQAAKDQAAREKRAAQLEKERTDAFVDWRNKLASVPFVPPAEGWTRESELGNARWYIILPKTGLAFNCHFAMNGSHPALDCLGDEGRNDYVSVMNNNRRYLLKTKRIDGGTGDHASSVKDGGLTLCLRQSGCYRVLAELREEPTELPDKLQVPPPADLTANYSSDDVKFNYPHNWKAEERKNNDNVVIQVGIAPQEAHVGNWVTNGLFVGHVLKMSDNFPQTLEGAYDQFSANQRLRGFVISDYPKTQTLGNSSGRIAAYTAPSVFKAAEDGWVAVVKDKGKGYYYLLMFYPSNDDSHLYAQTFNKILETFKFEK